MNKYEQHPLYKRFPPMKNESFAATLPPRAAYLDLSCATLDLLPQTLRLPPYAPSLLSSSLPPHYPLPFRRHASFLDCVTTLQRLSLPKLVSLR